MQVPSNWTERIAGGCNWLGVESKDGFGISDVETSGSARRKKVLIRLLSCGGIKPCNSAGI